ncbi:MAG: carbohydrate kinase family protein [Thermoplasmata archaeon]|nr:carbohydrate kinase family protein [Thermoplasmata archaeon]
MSLLVIGNIAYDTIARVKFLPNRNQATSIESIILSNGGCAGNVAVVANNLGVKTSLYSAVGEDFRDSSYQKQLLDFGIDLSYLQYTAELTARSFIFSDERENQQIYYYPGASSKLVERDVDFDRFTNIHFTAGEMSIYKNLMEKAKSVVISFDPGQEMFHRPVKEQIIDCLPFVSYLFLNEHEYNFLLDFIGSNDTRDLFGRKMRAIIVSRGKDGTTLYYRDEKIDIPAVNVKDVKDPTGAGDAHRAGFLAGIIKGFDETTACKIGNIAASFIIQEMGTQMNLPRWEDIEKMLDTD